MAADAPLVLGERIETDGEREVGGVLVDLETGHADSIVARDEGVVAAQAVDAGDRLGVEQLEHREEARAQPVLEPWQQAGHLQ